MDEHFAELSSKKCFQTDKSYKDLTGKSVMQTSSKALLIEDSFDSDKWEKSDLWSKVTDESFLNMEIECGMYGVQVPNDMTLLNAVEEPSFFNNDLSQSISTSTLLPMEHVVIERNTSSYRPSMLNVLPKRERIGFYDSLETDCQWSKSSSNSVEQVSSSKVSKGLKVEDVVPIFSLIKNVSYRASALSVFPKRKPIGFYNFLEEDSQGSISSKSNQKCSKTDGSKNNLAGPNVIQSSSRNTLLLEDSFESNDREDLWSKVTDDSFLNMEIQCGIYGVQSNSTMIHCVEEPSFLNDSSLLSESMPTYMLSPMQQSTIQSVNSSSPRNVSSHRLRMLSLFPRRKFVDDSQGLISNNSSDDGASLSNVSTHDI